MNKTTIKANTLHIIDTTGPGGAETLFITIANYFRHPGNETIAVVRGPGWVYDTLCKEGINTIIQDNKGSFNFAYLRFLVRLIRQHNIELIHAHLFGSAIYSSLAGLITGVPVVSTFHGLVDIKPDERLLKAKLAAVKHFSSMVAVSTPIRDMLGTVANKPIDSIKLIPNGIDCSALSGPKHNNLRNRLQLADGTLLVGCLGNIRPAKDYHNAIRAIGHVVQQGIDIHLIIAGDTNHKLFPELEKLCSDLELSNRVHFEGFISNADDFLSGIDVFMSSSSSEGQPLSVMQAMVKGLPIVVTRSGAQTLLEEDTNCWCCEAENPRALADTLAKVYQNPADRLRRGERARVTAQESYDINAMLKTYEQLYVQLIAAKRK